MKRILSIFLLGLVLLAPAAVKVVPNGSAPVVGGKSTVGVKGGTTASTPTVETLTNGLQFSYPMDRLAARERINGNNLTTAGTDIGLILVNNNRDIFPYDPRIDRCLTGGGASSGNRLSHTTAQALTLGTNDMTVSAWVHFNGGAIPGNVAFVDNSNIYDGGNTGWLLSFFNGSSFRFFVGNGTSWQQAISTVGASPSVSQWYLLVGRYSVTNQTLTISVNGTNTQTSTNWTGGRATNAQPFSLFAPSSAAGFQWPQLMDEVNGWNRRLTDAEVQRLYDYGNQKGQGYPWGTQTNKVVIMLMSARGLYPEKFPLAAEEFAIRSWASNNNAKVYCASNPPLQHRTAMYAAATGDAAYPIPLRFQSTNVAKQVGTGTNVYVIVETGENDVILINGGYTDWEGTIQTTFTAAQVAQSLTNALGLIWGTGIKGLHLSSIPTVTGFDPTEQANLDTINSYISAFTPRSSWWDAAAVMDPNTYGNDYEFASGHAKWASSNNVMFNLTWP